MADSSVNTTLAAKAADYAWQVRNGVVLSRENLARFIEEQAAALASHGSSPETQAAPEWLSGDDGEAHFVRCDVAKTEIAAREYAFGEGIPLNHYDADQVEMLPVPEHFTEIDYEWAVVRKGTPGAIRYWRFRL